MVDCRQSMILGPDTEAPKLSVELSLLGHTCVLTLVGELRCSTIPALEAYVDQLGCLDCPDVLLDLSDMGMLDDAGARVLVGLRHYVDARGGRLLIAGATDEALRLVTDADRVLGEHPPNAVSGPA